MKIPKKILGLPAPVVIVAGIAGVAYLYLRHSSVASGVAAAGNPNASAGGGGRGRAGPRGPAGKPGRKITKRITRTVYLCPKGYHRVAGRGCVRNAAKHPAHHNLTQQGG
jgi:hypothetical protein